MPPFIPFEVINPNMVQVLFAFIFGNDITYVKLSCMFPEANLLRKSKIDYCSFSCIYSYKSFLEHLLTLQCLPCLCYSPNFLVFNCFKPLSVLYQRVDMNYRLS